MNTGAFGENFPYSNFHDLNMNWIIKIAKDFLDQYTHIQETIDTGLTELDEKATALQTLLQEWYDTHSEDIANQLADALQSMQNALALAITQFNQQAEQKAQKTIASIPDDYTTVAQQAETAFNKTNLTEVLPNNTNLDNVLEQANYRGDASINTYLNKPDGITSVFALHVLNGGGNFRLQVIWSYLDNGQIVYTRYRFGATPTWSAWSLAYDSNKSTPFLNSVDLNTLLTQGNYRGDASINTYLNKPDRITSVFALHVLNGGGNFRIQVIWSYLDNAQIVYTRYRYGATPTWSAWSLAYDRPTLFGLTETPALPDGTDLNTLLDQKTYRGTADINTYQNIPEDVNSIFYLKTVNGTGNYRIQLLWQYVDNNQKIYTRYRYGATPVWSNWNKLYDQKEAVDIKNNDQSFTQNTKSFVYSNPVIASALSNTGTKMKILEYNLAHYTDDTQYSTLAFIPTDKVFNLKKLIGKTSPDIMLTCEDSKYIDGAPNITGSLNTKPSRTHVYSPVLPFEYGTEETFIRSKTPLTDGDTLKYTNSGRWLKFATATVNNKTLLIISTHNTPAYEGHTEEQLIAIRRIEYEELFKWAYGEIQLTSYTTGLQVTAPTWDYCIIGGDFNSITNQDRTNLASLAWQRDFSLSNGQWLGWVYTTETNSIDNILCSSNIIIDNIEVYNYLGNSLYSDHFPMAIDITLT